MHAFSQAVTLSMPLETGKILKVYHYKATESYFKLKKKYKVIKITTNTYAVTRKTKNFV